MDCIQPDSLKNCDLPPDVQEQLRLLDCSLSYIIYIIGALFLNCQQLTIKREMLIDSTCCPESFDPEQYPATFPIQITASLLTIYALLGFYGQSEYLADQAAQKGTETAAQCLDVTLSGMAVLIGLIRYLELAKTLPQQTAGPDTLENTIEDIETLPT